MTGKLNLATATMLCLMAMLFVSCDQAVEESVDMPGQQANATARFGSSALQFPKLTAEAQSKVDEWSVFDDFQTELNQINGSTVAELKTKTERLRLHADSLSKKVPNELYTNPITSRLVVLRSRISLLLQELNRGRIDSTEVAKQMAEFNTAATNFLLQINEKLEKDGIDLQREDDEKNELEKQKRFLDSVYMAERRDKNNR
jgi:hypothetical protein